MRMPFPQLVLSEDVKDAEAAVDQEIEAFNHFFQSELKNEPLIKSETAVLKTYLFWKTRSEKTNAP
jgi:hypothetical protein